MLLYSFVGVEVTAVTACEARNTRSLRKPSVNIGLVIFVLYLLVIVGEVLTVNWLDEDLPNIYGAVNSHISQSARTRTIVSIAALRTNHTRVSGIFNGCLMYAALSAANTNLYVSSRVLYGIAQKLLPSNKMRWLHGLGVVWSKNGVPMFALFISAIAFMWLPVLQGGFKYSTATVSNDSFHRLGR